MKKVIPAVLTAIAAVIALVACSSTAPDPIADTVTTTLPGTTVTQTDVTSETTTVVSTVPTTIVTSVPTTVVTTEVQTVPETVRVTVTSQPSGKTVSNGDYLVGTDIKTGTWQCREGDDGGMLYWATSNKAGDLLDNDLGSIARVTSNAYAVKLSHCAGEWTRVD